MQLRFTSDRIYGATQVSSRNSHQIRQSQSCFILSNIYFFLKPLSHMWINDVTTDITFSATTDQISPDRTMVRGSRISVLSRC